jgi:hypothetical protein
VKLARVLRWYNSIMLAESSDLREARDAKGRAREVFGRFGKVNGVGITRQGGRYAVKVSFEAPPQSGDLPREIAGVPVIFQVVGKIHKQPA